MDRGRSVAASAPPSAVTVVTRLARLPADVEEDESGEDDQDPKRENRTSVHHVSFVPMFLRIPR